MTVNYIQNFSSMRQRQCLSTNKLIQGRKHSVGAWGEFLGGLKGLHYKERILPKNIFHERLESMKPGLLQNSSLNLICLPSTTAANVHLIVDWESPPVMSTSLQSSLLHYHFCFHNISSSLLSSQHFPPCLVLLFVCSLLIWSVFLVCLQEQRAFYKLFKVSNLAC